jgi:flagellin
MHEWNGFPILNGKAGTPVGTPTTITSARAGAASATQQKVLETGDLEIQTDKGSFAIPASKAATDPKSNTIAAGSNNAGSAIAIAAAINSQVGVTGVSAVAGAATVAATKTTVGSTSIQTDLYVNGEKVSLSLSASHTLNQRRQYVMESINAGTTVHGVLAGDSGTGGLTLTTPDGRNLSVWYDSTSVQGSDFGLGLDTTPPSNPLGVTGIAGAAASTFGSNEAHKVTFPALSAGQGFTLNGLTFTAGSGGTNDVQTAAAFANLKSGMTAVAAAAANLSSAALGSFSGTFAEGFTTGAVVDTMKVVATANNKGNVGGITTSDAIPTIAKTEGSSTQTELNVVTFKALNPNEFVTVNGLTFTARVNMTSNEVAAAFSNIASGATSSAVTAANPLAANFGKFSGTFGNGWSTAGVTASTATAGASVTATSTVTLPTVVATTAGANTGSIKQVSTVTFSDLGPGQAFTLAGLTFLAGSAGATVAQLKAVFDVPTTGQAFGDVNTALGNLTGAATIATTVGRFTAGTFAAGAFDGSGVFTATSAADAQINLAPAAVNSDVADLTVSGSKAVAATTAVITAGTTVAASTVYGTVTLNSNSAFTVKPGAKAYAAGGTPAADPTYANFTALGFEAKTINPKNIGRLNFQVGPAANQLISIDLADFGKNGDITGPITSDRAPTNLLTVNSSNDVIMNVNKSLDRIAATRATMGAVMNRLEHVIDNLTNVVMNSEASRSQIEDADYAQASTELARTQIMQQAATAVLAQANTSQQTVLKLLQG